MKEHSSRCGERFYNLGHAKTGRGAELAISIHVELLCTAHLLPRGFLFVARSKILRHDRLHACWRQSRCGAGCPFPGFLLLPAWHGFLGEHMCLREQTYAAVF